MFLARAGSAALAVVMLSACVTTSMQGYADRELPIRPISRIVAYVAGPGPLVSSIQSSIRDEAAKRGIAADDALLLFPPTRTYTDAEIRQVLATHSIDGVLIINVGDTGVMRQYAGTILQGQYTGSSLASGTATRFGNTSTVSVSGTSVGRMTGTATPMYRYSRQTAFTARLLESTTGRNLWVGNGQVNAGGLLFVGNSTSASTSVIAIFDDLQQKRIIGPTS